MVNKHDVETVIVLRPAVAVPNPGDSLYVDSTKAFNLAVGSAGFYIDEAGSGNPVALDPNTYAGEPFRMIHRRDTTADRSPLYNLVLEQSQYIHGNCPLKLQYGGQPATNPKNSCWLHGSPNAASTGKIEVLSNNVYTLNASAYGYRKDLVHGVFNTPTIQARFESPNWASSSITTENRRRDYTVKAMVRDFNRKVSTGFQRFAFAVCIDSAGTTSAGSTILALSAAEGSTVTIGYEAGCTPVSMYIDTARAQAFADLETFLTTSTGSGGMGLGAGVAKLAPYALSENCSSGEIAGDGSSAADMIFVISIDDTQAYYDEVPNTKTRLVCGFQPGSSLTAVRNTEVSHASEGEGLARNLLLSYEGAQQYKQYVSPKKWGANHVEFGHEIISTELYDIYTLTHCHSRVATSGMPSYSPHTLTIAVVNFEDANSAYYNSGNPNPQKTYIESVLNAVGSHFGLPSINL